MNLENAKKELYLCTKFFLDNFSRKDESYGLVADIFPSKHNTASIAGTGYLFSSLVIASEFNFMKKSEAKMIALKALKSISNLETSHGWYYHFYDIETGKKTEWLELSNIDTSIMFLGILTCGNYFGGECLNLAKMIFNRADHNYFLQKYGYMLSMAVNRNGDFVGHWDVYAEQLMLYILGSASENENFRLDKQIYYNFKRDIKSYKDKTFICSWYGAIFTHQFSHAYIDFRNKVDEQGVDWFKNSVIASEAAYEYALDSEGQFKSFNRFSWGLTACMSKNGYCGLYGSPPSGIEKTTNDGTVAPCAAIGSIVFTPKESLDALNYFYSIDKLVGEYGLYDSYNADQDFYSNQYVSIDKGIEMVMLANYLKGTIWHYFNSLDIIQESFKRLGIKEA